MMSKIFVRIVVLVLVFSFSFNIFAYAADVLTPDGLVPNSPRMVFSGLDDGFTPAMSADVTWASGSAGVSPSSSIDDFSGGYSAYSGPFSYNDLGGVVYIHFNALNTGETLEKGTYTISTRFTIYGRPVIANSASVVSSLVIDGSIDPNIGGLILTDYYGNTVSTQNVSLIQASFVGVNTKSVSRVARCFQPIYTIDVKYELVVSSLDVSGYYIVLNPTSTIDISSSGSFQVPTTNANIKAGASFAWTNVLSGTGSVDSGLLSDIAGSMSSMNNQTAQMVSALQDQQFILELIASYLNGSTDEDTLIKQIATASNNTYQTCLQVYALLQVMNTSMNNIYSKLSAFESAFTSFASSQLADNDTIIADLLLIQNEIRVQGESIVAKLDEIIAAFNEAMQNAGDSIDSSNSSLSGAESDLIGSVPDGDTSFDYDLDGAINDIGTGGLTLINTLSTNIFDTFPWIFVLVMVFLFAYLAKRLLS